MNKLIIIGNGFDLAHGLKTRYSDFLLAYLNKIVDKLIVWNQKTHNDELVQLTLRLLPSRIFDSLSSFKDFVQQQDSDLLLSEAGWRN